MAKKEDKYIVVKREDFEKLKVTALHELADGVTGKRILRDMQGLEAVCERLDKGNKYITINQDEPYADAVWDIILAFETLKENITG